MFRRGNTRRGRVTNRLSTVLIATVDAREPVDETAHRLADSRRTRSWPGWRPPSRPRVWQPSSQAPIRSLLVTPLHRQMVASAGISVGEASGVDRWSGAPVCGTSRVAGSTGSGVRRSKATDSDAETFGAPSAVNPTSRSRRTTTSTCRRACGSERATTRSSAAAPLPRIPRVTRSTPAALRRTPSGRTSSPLSARRVDPPVSSRASRAACSQPGATSPLTRRASRRSRRSRGSSGPRGWRGRLPTVTPRPVGSPAAAASPVSGRTPQETSIRSVEMTEPSVRRTATSSPYAPMTSATDVEVCTRTPRSSQRPGQHGGHRRVELVGHQVPVEVHHRDRQPAAGEPAGRLEPEDPAAEDDGVAGVDGAGDHVAAVVDGAQDVHVARRLVAGETLDRRHERAGTRGQHEVVVLAARCRRRARPAARRGRSRSRPRPAARRPARAVGAVSAPRRRSASRAPR